MLFLEYPPCSTGKKAKNWLMDHGVEFTARHIKEHNPTAEEISLWQAKSGLELKKFFNTSGMIYRDLGRKDKLPGMSREEQLQLLASDGMRVKRPILVTGDTVLVGFKEKAWEKLLQK